jgi:hypothetical protein
VCFNFDKYIGGWATFISNETSGHPALRPVFRPVIKPTIELKLASRDRIGLGSKLPPSPPLHIKLLKISGAVPSMG